jgi:hypothetical protein
MGDYQFGMSIDSFNRPIISYYNINRVGFQEYFLVGRKSSDDGIWYTGLPTRGVYTNWGAFQA